MFDLLPNELLEHIFNPTWLDIRWHFFCRHVCKKWRIIVDNIRYICKKDNLPSCEESIIIQRGLSLFLVEQDALSCLEWIRHCEWDASVCSHAVELGRLDILKWLKKNGCPWNVNTCSYAAKNGHLELLKWAQAQGCLWSYNRMCHHAAQYGQLDILKWCKNNGCTLDAQVCALAASFGSLEIIQYLRGAGCEWDDSTCMNAAKKCHLHVLK